MGRAPSVNIRVNSNVNINKIIDDAINNTTVNKQNNPTIISNNNINNATHNLFNNSELEEVDLYADSQINTNSHTPFAQEKSNVNTLGENSNLQDVTSSYNNNIVNNPSEEINQSRILNSNSQNLNQSSNNYVNSNENITQALNQNKSFMQNSNNNNLNQSNLTTDFQTNHNNQALNQNVNNIKANASNNNSSQSSFSNSFRPQMTMNNNNNNLASSLNLQNEGNIKSQKQSDQISTDSRPIVANNIIKNSTQILDDNHKIITIYNDSQYNEFLSEYISSLNEQIAFYTSMNQKLDQELNQINLINNNSNFINKENSVNIYINQLYELTHTSRSDSFANLIQKIKTSKDQNVLSLWQTSQDYIANNLNSIIINNSNYQDYIEFRIAEEKFKNDKLLIAQAINKIEEQIKLAPYNLLVYNKDFQDYEYHFSPSTDNMPAPSRSEIPSQENLDMFINEENLKVITQTNEIIPKTYFYLKESQGQTIANEYYNLVADEVKRIQGQNMAEEFLKTLSKEDNIMAAISNHLKVTTKGLDDGVENFAWGLIYSLEPLMTENREYSVMDYEKMYIINELINGNLSGKFLNNNYEISQSIGNMAPSMALGILTTPIVGTSLMGISAGEISVYTQNIGEY